MLWSLHHVHVSSHVQVRGPSPSQYTCCSPVGLGPISQVALVQSPHPHLPALTSFSVLHVAAMSDPTLSNLTCSRPRGREGGSPGRPFLLTQLPSACAGPACRPPSLPSQPLERLKIDFIFKAHSTSASALPARFLPSVLTTPFFLSCSSDRVSVLKGRGGESDSERPAKPGAGACCCVDAPGGRERKREGPWAWAGCRKVPP